MAGFLVSLANKIPTWAERQSDASEMLDVAGKKDIVEEYPLLPDPCGA